MNHQESELAAHPDTHYHPALNNLPGWLLTTSPTTRSALNSAPLDAPLWHASTSREQRQAMHLASQQHLSQRNHLETTLSSLKNARDFAEPLLKAALKKHCGLDLDVKTTFLRLYIPQYIPWFSIRSGAARTWTVSLLEAALHNFEEAETLPEAYESASTFITQPTPTGQFDTLPALKAKLPLEDFTGLCRQLDLGGQYQAYLEEYLGFNNPVAAAVLQSKVSAMHKAALGSALQLARLRGDVPEDAYQAITALVQDGKGALLAGQTLQGHDLSMMSSRLTGIVVFAPRLESARQAERVIAYIPDDPQHPLKLYPDAEAFMAELSRKLREPAYQTFFSRFVDHGERGHFFADLNSRLSHVTWHPHAPGEALPSWRDTPVDNPNLQYSVQPIRANLWTYLYQRQLDKLLNDARTQAVSTASADRHARWALWDALSKIATSILQVASFVALPFVPFLGELMLAYMAYQILDETFEGIVDWAEGLKTEAFGHLMSLVETAVQLGTFAIGTTLAGNAVKQLMPAKSKGLFDALNLVKSPDGKTRYWKPDLTPYEQSIDLPAESRPDRRGLYQHHDKTLLRLEDRLYSVSADSTPGQFRIEHPNRAEAYRPPLRHNEHGAWQTALDQPLSWDRETLMRRLGHRVESFSSAEREQILQISGFHDNVLRETHVEHQRPPSLLTDTIKRFKIDRDIQALVEQSASDDPDRFQALNQRQSLFESRYRTLEKTTDRRTQLLIAEVQGLPTDIAQELVDNSTGSELTLLDNGRVPQRLKDVALKALEAVRVARAYEGFYIADMESPDTHRLALHCLQSMPGWPADVRIEIRAFSSDGVLQDSIGEPDAPILKTLVRAEDGSFSVPGSAQPPGDFYQAILDALPADQRKGLRLAANESTALKQRIAQHAASLPELRRVFAKHPHRKPFYDPTTLRLPGGTDGYTHESFPGPLPSLYERTREVYPSLGPQELQAVVADLQSHPDGARVELSRRANEFHQLHLDLSTWIYNTPTVHPETGVALTEVQYLAQQHNRRLLAQEIQRSWRRQTERDYDGTQTSARYTLRFPEPILGDLPPLTADFSHVSFLRLEGSHAEHGMQAFLKNFKNLGRLDLRRVRLTTLPDSLAQMTTLDALILNDCGIMFNADAWAKLSGLKKLRVLDLFRNPFETVPDIGPLPNLLRLDLSDTGLTDVPPSALNHARLDTLILTDNLITEVPAPLFDSALYNKRGVHLGNNPLSQSAREQIKLHYLESAYDMGVYAPQADIDRVTALYPYLEPERASEFIYQLPGTLEHGRAELANLEAELARLSDDLANWMTQLPAQHPLTGQPFTAQEVLLEQASRDEFKQALEKCWRHESELDDFNEALEPTFELVIRPQINGELPTLSADFSHVSSLTLDSADGVTRVGRFLEAFPHLSNLRLRGCDLGDIPQAVFKMGRLRSLSLTHCRIHLSADSVSALTGMEQLDYLDLGDNPLGHTPDLSQMPDLSTVLLNDTGIAEIPRGLFELKELEWADLSGNAITEVSSDVMELPLDIAENITLRGNPFNEQSLQRLIRYFERTRADFGVQAVIDQGEMDISTSEGSEVEV